MTTAVKDGFINKITDPNSAATVTVISNMFHPEAVYSFQPKPIILNRASIKNTENYRITNKNF